ncbi:MAG: putative molybdopterin-guanine dinucleotide biosynthesis protein A [Candidatus Bathyarchaeota archaeon B63]|nr:MAG: putative molybdopterin-guanine dinucleotide biosynthesis protein A [Candidatus Bathyarchaeota archaeon B63]
MKNRTCIILAGGSAERFGRDKGLLELGGRPLVLHVFERVRELVDEVIAVVGSEEQKTEYSSVFPQGVKIHVDIKDGESPLIGALTGLARASGSYSLLLPCDAPFISTEVIDLLFEASIGVDASIPRWPNGYIEPLQAVYRTRTALSAAEEAVDRGELRMRSMISRLRRVRYFSTMVLRELDPDLLTFFNVNTIMDLKRAEALMRARRSR